MATLEASIPAQGTAGTAQDNVIGEVPFAGTVTEVSFVPEAAVTANASNYRIFRVLNKGQAGAGSTVVATRNTATTGLTAFDETTATLSSTAADLVVAAGDVLVFDETVAGTGVAHSGGVVKVQITA